MATEQVYEDGPVYTMEEALAQVGIGKFQYMAMCYAGLGYIAVAAETMILSFIGPALRSQWALSPTQESLMFLLACLWEIFFGDSLQTLMEEGKNPFKIYNFLLSYYLETINFDLSVNRKGLLTIAVVTAVCAALSTFSPNYYCLLAVRMMVGFGVGGGPVYGSWLCHHKIGACG